MVVRCAWGTCNSDQRYPERLVGLKFHSFPNPKNNREKCERWIKACGRPHWQLNVDRINKNKAICSKVMPAFYWLNVIEYFLENISYILVVN